MANRVSSTDVKKIIDTELVDIDIDIFIDTAAEIIKIYLSDAGLADTLLAKIELFLSAHLVTLREQQVSSEKYGNASATYQGKTGMHLTSSHFGQTAMTLDVTGKLASAGKGVSTFEVI